MEFLVVGDGGLVDQLHMMLFGVLLILNVTIVTRVMVLVSKNKSESLRLLSSMD